MSCIRQRLHSWWAQPNQLHMSQSRFILSCFVRLLHHPELHKRLQGAVWTLLSAHCPGFGLLQPLQQPEWGCMGLCLQRLICPSTSESRGPPAILGCCQKLRPVFDSLRRKDTHVLSPYTCLHTKEEHAGDLAVHQSGDKKTPTHAHTHKGVHVPEETRDSSTSLLLPQNYLSPNFASTKTEMSIFRELIFRMIHSQKGGMKGFLRNIFWVFLSFQGRLCS